MDQELEGIKFAKRIDFSRVHSNDRQYLREIMLRVLNFHTPMPKLDVDIYDAGDHYNISLKGWNLEISDRKWYKTFLSRKRETTFDRILDTGDVPTDDGNTTIKIIRVSKSTYSKSKRGK